MKRNSWKVGDYLMVDQISGVTHYASEMAQDWDGTWRLATDLDGKHPDLIRKPIIREYLPQQTVPEIPVSAYSNFRPRLVGSTNVLTADTPADHLFSVSAQ